MKSQKQKIAKWIRRGIARKRFTMADVNEIAQQSPTGRVRFNAKKKKFVACNESDLVLVK